MSAKKQTKSASVGRPSKYKPEFPDMLIAHMSQGFSFETFAGQIGVNPDTLYQWLKDPDKTEFSDAKRIAVSKCQYYWEEIGQRGVNGKIRNFSSAAWIFSMKNRFKWHDNVHVNAVTEDKNTAKLEELAEKLTKAVKTSMELK